MPKEKEQREKRELDEELDRQLEGTFPASDPLNIARPNHEESPGGPVGNPGQDSELLARSRPGALVQQG
jgi:hypothetical protein